MHPQPNKQDYIKHVQKAGHVFRIAQMEKKQIWTYVVFSLLESKSTKK